ncbi:pyruvate synthase subunit PorB [Methanobrevibacter woesei]|jgi:pyruvate ferredoxin oxidoreductase beta subunit|uniref:Pyruvate synthase subunit PorB n=1 Tax=Methanobrevibacter woesei TaxID=190976 RepID=A0A2U1S5T2_9EURY|nr:pyruvate synthase subunit PorB [Methanobrevibacter woesei]MCI7290868.1 pyruvate synthase subunit PorB [Methanobrevibacter woesei]PWB84955.1 pyruvate synthase subunit PorB [Methanobrevibacter woesei]
MKIPEEELLAPGHRGCAGCGASIGVRLALKALGKNTVAISATGCLEVMTTPYPETAWEIPWIHVAFENAGAVASGVESALRIQGKDDVNVVAFGGDGGTVDIGLQSLSGAMERGHNFTYICYDNEAYMNTGIQRSGATPYGASTTTSPVGKDSFGENKPKKNMPMIMAAHGIPYVATASISYPEDFMKKVKKAAEVDGPAYIHLNQPCTTGWGYPSSKTIEMGRLAVETGSWILYEIENGEFNVTYRPSERKPVSEYLKPQKRFRHLTEDHIEEIQKLVDSQCEELGL